MLGQEAAEPELSSDLAQRIEAQVHAEARIAEAQRSHVVRLPGWLSDSDIAAVHACAQQIGGAGRSLSGSSYRAGQWSTSYLNVDGRFRKMLPSLCAMLVEAAEKVNFEHWQILQGSSSVNIRVVEYHTVRSGGALPWPHHFDEGSLLTIDCMLSPTDHFEGGSFQTLESDGTFAVHPFERGDVQIFPSHKYQCVAPVRSGQRNVLVLELWDGVERNCAHRCECRWTVCPHDRRHAVRLEAQSARVFGASESEASDDSEVLSGEV